MSHQYVIPHRPAIRNGEVSWRDAAPPLIVPRNAIDVHKAAIAREFDSHPETFDRTVEPLEDTVAELATETYDLEQWFCRPVTLSSGTGRRAYTRSYLSLHRPQPGDTPSGWQIPVVPRTEFWRSAVTGLRPEGQLIDAADVFVEDLVAAERRGEFLSGMGVSPGHPPIRYPRLLGKGHITLGAETWWLRSDGWERTRIVGEPRLDSEDSVSAPNDSETIYLLPEDLYFRWTVDAIRPTGYPGWADVMYQARREHVWLI